MAPPNSAVPPEDDGTNVLAEASTSAGYSEDNGHESSSDKEDDYETSYSKLQKLKGRYGCKTSNAINIRKSSECNGGGITGQNRQRRRRGGYGSSILESINDRNLSSNEKKSFADDAFCHEFAMDDLLERSLDRPSYMASGGSIGNTDSCDEESMKKGCDTSNFDENDGFNESEPVHTDASGHGFSLAVSHPDPPICASDHLAENGNAVNGNEDQEKDREKKNVHNRSSEILVTNDLKVGFVEAELEDTEASGHGFSLAVSRPGFNTEGSNNEMEDEQYSSVEEISDEREENERMVKETKSKVESSTSTFEETLSNGESHAESNATPDLTDEPSEHNRSQLFEVVDSIFVDADKESMTVGDVVRSVAAHFGIPKVKKDMKNLIRERLTDLISGNLSTGEENESLKKINNKGSDDNASPNKHRTRAKYRTFRGETKKVTDKRFQEEKSIDSEAVNNRVESDFEDESQSLSDISNGSNHGRDSGDEGFELPLDDEDDSNYGGKASKKPRRNNDKGKRNSSDQSEPPSSTDEIRTKKGIKRRTRTRKSRSSKSGKMSQHLRDNDAKIRQRQIEEARIRKEELGHLANEDNADANNAPRKLEEGPQLAEQDRLRALAIAERFDTNRGDLRAKREKDRKGLIGQLRQKRLEIISLKQFGEERLKDNTPKPTATSSLKLNNVENKDGAKPIDVAMVELDNDESSYEDDSDDELEIVAPTIEKKIDAEVDVDRHHGSHPRLTPTLAKTESSGPSHEPASPLASNTFTLSASALDHLLTNPRDCAVVQSSAKKKANVPANLRVALRNSLRARQIKAGNRWLARELGYKNEEEHIRDCKEAENKKRERIFLQAKNGEQALLGQCIRDELMNVKSESKEEDEEEALAREFEDTGPGSEIGSEDEEENAYSKVNEREDPGKDSEIRSMDGIQIQRDEKNYSRDALNLMTAQVGGDSEREYGFESKGGCTSEKSPLKIDHIKLSKANTLDLKISQQVEFPALSEKHPELSHASTETNESEGEKSQMKRNDSDNDLTDNAPLNNTPETEGVNDPSQSDSDDLPALDNIIGVDDENLTSNNTVQSEENVDYEKPKKPKNSAWQAMLNKEKVILARQKKIQRKGGGLVEGEAEEEEEEGGIVGLEDFGFAVQKRKDDDDDDEAEADVDDDDLDHVVDDVSDGEGDEEAGEEARKQLEAKEEKERHKEIMRRMREGYNGRFAGIASGSGRARGMHRFDQLVAADNRDDAKRLGLLNDDEIEDEKASGKDSEQTKDDEDDEAALLDKMLKDRFLRTQEQENYIEEHFSDDEEDDEMDETEMKVDEDDEEREQERLAKRFAKRARMNRILEAYEGDSQFSRSRLIDEDESMQQDLKMIKTSVHRKRGISSMTSYCESKESSHSNSSRKRQKLVPHNEAKHMVDGTEGSVNFLSQGGSLSVALKASRSSRRKNKTTFISGKERSNLSRSYSTSSSKSVSLNHVVFTAGEGQSSCPDTNGTSMPSLFRTGSQQSNPTHTSSRLWGRVCAKNFQSQSEATIKF